MYCHHCKFRLATLKDLSGKEFYCLSCAIHVFGYPHWTNETIILTEEEMEASTNAPTS